VLVLGEEAALTEAMHQSTPTEGPPTITLSFYINEEAVSLGDWVRTKQESNFHLSLPPLGGTFVSTEVAHLPALRYHVSGLYEAEYIVFMYGTRVVVVAADDRGMRTERDLQTILTSMKLL
jgi:hypothetical protein